MQFAAVGMPTSSQHREEERLRQEQERREKERQQAQFLQRTFGLPQEEVPLEDFSCALQALLAQRARALTLPALTLTLTLADADPNPNAAYHPDARPSLHLA